MKGFDCNTKLSYEKACEFKADGYDFAIRYVGRLKQASFDIDQTEVNNILSSGLKLGIVQHCPASGWEPDKELGITYGQNAVKFSKEAGYRKDCIVYLDLEGILPGTDKFDIIAFCNAWYNEVVKEYTPGIYIGFNMFLSSEELYKKLKFKHYWKSLSKVPDVYKRGYEMTQKAECEVNKIQIDPDEVTGDKLGNYPVFMEGMVHRKEGLTDIIELDPMQLKAAKILGTWETIKLLNFVNCNFFSGTKTIGWLISEGKVLNERHEYRDYGKWKGNKKGTFIVYRDGTVDVGWKYDSEIAPIIDDIWFCCQGFNLFPYDILSEGFTSSEASKIIRTTNRLALYYNKTANKAIIAVRPLSNAQRAIKTGVNLGCDKGICLDSGYSVNVCINGKMIYKTNAQLTNELYW